MSSTTIGPLTEITRDVPDDLTTIADDAVAARLKAGLEEILLGRGCLCNGLVAAREPTLEIVRQRSRATAVVRGIEAGLKEVAVSRNIDPDSSPAVLSTVMTPDEMAALTTYVSATTTAEVVARLVSNDEMAVIEAEELTRTHRVRDPGWGRDLTQLIARANPHYVYSTTPEGIAVVETVTVKLDTLRASVDNNGELMSWTYEEPVI